MNEVLFTSRGCSVLYRGKNLCFSCPCSEQPHVLPTHAKWYAHHMRNFAREVTYHCSNCERSFSNIRSVAQHRPRCGPVLSDSENSSSSQRDSECSFCTYRALNKRGLSRHEHRKHPTNLFELYSSTRLIDSRWTLCEKKILTKAIDRSLRSRGLQLNVENTLEAARESYLEIESKVTKTLDQVLNLCAKGSFQELLLARRKKKEKRELKRTANEEMETEELQEQLPCDCLNQVRKNAGVQLANIKHVVTDRRLRQLIKRGLSSQSTQTGTLLLDYVYKRFGEKIDGRSKGKVGPREQRKSRNSSTENDTELYRKLKSKGYLNHLCNPALRDLKPSKEAIEWFGGQFERPSIEDSHPYECLERGNSTCSIHATIGELEVDTHRRSFDKDTACGTDEFSTAQLMSVPLSIIVLLMNLFLLDGDVPETLKTNRTTLLAKKANPGPTEWRPITVSSVIYRLFSKIITARLARETQLSPHQRAFIQGIDGCGENISVVAMLIKRANAGHGPLMVCSLDLAKAFDSVSFSSIVRALKRQGVDRISLSLLENMVYNNVTIVSGCKKAKITRGVRQGDPISPLLFNLVIDELFCRLKDKRYGASYVTRNGETERIAAVAFADDVTLLSDSQRCLEKLLTTSVKFFTQRGMKININKSSCLAIGRLPGTDVYTTLPAKVTVKSPETGELEYLQCIKPNEEIRILGAYISPGGKSILQMGRLCELLEIVKNSPLDSYHKVEIIRQHIVFSYRFQVTYGDVCSTIAYIADAKIRKCIRDIYALPKHVARSFFYLPMSQGGLGIESLGRAAEYLRVKTELRLLHSQRVATSEAISLAKVRDGYLMRSREALLGRQGEEEFNPENWLTTNSDHLLRQLKGIDAETWYLDCRKGLVVQDLNNIKSLRHGAAFHHLANNASNGYLLEPDKYNLEISKIPMIYNIRLGTINVLSNLKKYNGVREDSNNYQCRLCRNSLETPMHVMQKCPQTKRWQNERHNAIAGLLYREIEKGLNGEHSRVIKEPELILGTGGVRLKPDIVVVSRKSDQHKTKIAIIDVTCCWEQSASTLNRSYNYKCNKYGKLKDWLGNQDGLRVIDRSEGESGSYTLTNSKKDRSIDVQVLPYVLGVRGGWIPSNRKLLNFLELGRGKLMMNRLHRTCAERSINIFKKFMGRVRAEG